MLHQLRRWGVAAVESWEGFSFEWERGFGWHFHYGVANVGSWRLLLWKLNILDWCGGSHLVILDIGHFDWLGLRHRWRLCHDGRRHLWCVVKDRHVFVLVTDRDWQVQLTYNIVAHIICLLCIHAFCCSEVKTRLLL